LLQYRFKLGPNWQPDPTADAMEAFVCASPRVVGVEKIGEECETSITFSCLFHVVYFFEALDTLFAAWQVSVIRILCSSYYILHISRHYISVGTRIPANIDWTCATAAPAFLQSDQVLHNGRHYHMYFCISPVLRLPFVSVAVVMFQADVERHQPISPQSVYTIGDSGL